VMRAWYDIERLDEHNRADEAGIRATAAAVGALIERENDRGIPADRIVLAGFSQGGAAVLFTALRYSQSLAAVVALSCYLPMAKTLAAEMHAANRQVPIFMAHGEADHVVPYWIGENSRDALLGAGLDVTWHSYPMMHSVAPEELGDIRAFLDRHISPR
ncbi:MAG: dienelactone hydrolase family protein, partial [Gammaproteobacteria bacterium]|nr:dienelactone hydrolase family protein [Gammaproteobacteria bacterium]